MEERCRAYLKSGERCTNLVRSNGFCGIRSHQLQANSSQEIK